MHSLDRWISRFSTHVYTGRSRSVARVYTHIPTLYTIAEIVDGPGQVGSSSSSPSPRHVRVPYSAARIGVVCNFPVSSPTGTYINISEKNAYYYTVQLRLLPARLTQHLQTSPPPISHIDRTSSPAHDPPVHINNMYSRNSLKPYASFSPPSSYIRHYTYST
jgi:hypothetical protein